MREFALTLSAAVVMSAVLSLTLTPMLCGQYLRPPAPSTNRFMLALERGFVAIETSYARGLDRVMRHMRLTLDDIPGHSCLDRGALFDRAYGFLPSARHRVLERRHVTSQDASFGKISEKVEKVGRIIASDRDVEEIHLNVGGGSLNQSNFNVALTSRDGGRTAKATR